MKNVQNGAKLKREKERKHMEASAQERDKMYSTDLSDFRMKEVNERKKINQEEKIK
jgi:hypothetical protein